jgi:RND family efflux transporter MFP subunit
MKRQLIIRRFAGIVILVSLTLAHYHSVNWLWLTAFVGFNLLQSSFTGFCPLEIVLKRFGIGGITVLALGTTLLSGCGRSSQGQSNGQSCPPPLPVRVQKAQSAPRTNTEEVVGTVRARTHATLEAKVSGRIDQMSVVLGQRVKAGQLLAHLDAGEIKARLEQAQAAQTQAERDWKRASELFNDHVAARSEYDAAEARLRVTRAAATEAQAMMDYVQVVAPFEGVVTKKWADVGDLAAPGKPLIDIEEPSRLQVEADVPEAIASSIQQGARIGIRRDSSSQELSGTVTEISPAVDPLSRTLRVKLDLPETAGLMSGQFVRLLVPAGESHPVCVPLEALAQRGQLEMVFVVADHHAQMRLVRSGRRFGAEVEILAGLEAGEPVVANGVARLMDGQLVAEQ